MKIDSWLAEALDQKVGAQTALVMVNNLAPEPERSSEVKASLRAADRTICFHQSERD